MSFVYTQAGRRISANAWRGAGPGSSDTLLVKLFTAYSTITTTMTSGDVTEAAFGGYAEHGTTYGASGAVEFDGDDAVVAIDGAPISWDCTSDPETILGWYLVDGPSGDIMAIEQYDTPHVLEVGSRHTLNLKLAQGACS